MDNIGFFEAPDAYSETARVAAVDKFLALKHWEDRLIFTQALRQIRKCVGPIGVAIGLVHKHLVHIKFETKFEYKETPRSVLFDSHTILSRKPMLIADTLKDWRFANNPLVVDYCKIRFYCGIPMVTKEGEAIGCLSIFDTSPNANMSGSKIERLEAISREFLHLLELSHKAFLNKLSVRFANLHTQAEIDFMKLSLKLGRATSKGGCMAVFERDGSGSAYCRNLNFEDCNILVNKKVSRSTLPSVVSQSVRKLLSETTTIRKAFESITKSINVYHRLDFTCVMEIRFLELYQLPAQHFPSGNAKVYLESYPKKHKLIKKDGKVRIQLRVIAKYGGDYKVESTDVEVWQKAFNSEFGVQMKNLKNSAIFNHALIMPFYRVKPNLVRDTRFEPKDDMCDVFLRSGGYLLGIFSKKRDDLFETGRLSRFYDHVLLVQKVCMGK